MLYKEIIDVFWNTYITKKNAHYENNVFCITERGGI